MSVNRRLTREIRRLLRVRPSDSHGLSLTPRRTAYRLLYIFIMRNSNINRIRMIHWTEIMAVCLVRDEERRKATWDAALGLVIPFLSWGSRTNGCDSSSGSKDGRMMSCRPASLPAGRAGPSRIPPGWRPPLLSPGPPLKSMRSSPAARPVLLFESTVELSKAPCLRYPPR